MQPKSYEYAHRMGVHKLTWEEFAEGCDLLSKALAEAQIDWAIGIARGGLLPATIVACNLRVEMFPIRLSRREADRVVHEHPVWRTDLPGKVEGKILAVIDDIADSGETLSIVAERCMERGAKKVIRTALAAHTWADPFPECVALISDALVLFPWDRKVLVNGRWQLHPEIIQALDDQGLSPSDVDLPLSDMESPA